MIVLTANQVQMKSPFKLTQNKNKKVFFSIMCESIIMETKKILIVFTVQVFLVLLQKFLW